MSFEFFGVLFGLGQDNEVMVSSSYRHKKKISSKLINFSFTSNRFIFWDEKEQQKDKIKKEYAEFLKKEKFEEKATFFSKEFEKMKNICDHKDITWFEERKLPGTTEECFYFKANSLNKQTKVMMIPKSGNGSIVNERYPDLEFIFTWYEALTEEELGKFLPAITFQSKDRIRLLFELRQNNPFE